MGLDLVGHGMNLNLVAEVGFMVGDGLDLLGPRKKVL